MKKLIFLIICIPLFAFSQQTINGSIIHDNLQRDYILYVPAMYNATNPTPLVFNFHGYTSNASAQMWYGDFRSIADTAGFIIAHPMGSLDNSGITHWNVGWGGSTVDDIGFTAALIDSLSANYNINQDRIYSTGMSNGGYFSYHLACNLSTKIAAIASVTGAMSQYTQTICNPSHPTPVMEIHGTADLTVPFNDIISGLGYWRSYNNCNPISDTTIIPDLVLGDWSTVEHIVFDNGDNGVTTELFKVINGEHTWPGSNFSSGVTNYDINASAEIWRFFSKYDINGLINSSTFVAEIENKGKKFIKIVDVLGRECLPKKNTTLFYIFDDGSVEKKLIFK